MSNFIGDRNAPEPDGWEFTVPKYCAGQDLGPAPKSRYRFEPPFSTDFGQDVWQYGEQPVKAGDIIETKAWPHPTMRPLNYSAARVLEFFSNRTKSRLSVSPWRGDRVHLDDGLTFSAAPIIIRHGPQLAAQEQPADVRRAAVGAGRRIGGAL